MKPVTGDKVAKEFKKQTSEFKRYNYSQIRQHISELQLAHLKDTLVVTKRATITGGNYRILRFSEKTRSMQSAYFGHDNFSLCTVCV